MDSTTANGPRKQSMTAQSTSASHGQLNIANWVEL